MLYDTVDPAVLYVFTPAERGGKGKVVVRVNFTAKIQLDEASRAGVTTNSIRSGGYVQTRDLPESRYQRIQGDVE